MLPLGGVYCISIRMGLNDKVNDLKDKPKDERVAVASGIAVTVVVILLVVWGLLFFKRIQSGTQTVDLTGGVQDQFNMTSVRQAQEQLQHAYGQGASALDELKELQKNSLGNTNVQQMELQQVANPTGHTEFGNQSNLNDSQ